MKKNPSPSKKQLKGIITALATPFIQGDLDRSSFKNLLELQILQGVDGFVINGTTGESPCLSQKEVEHLFKWTQESAHDKTLILGVGGNCTKKTIANIKIAEQLGASAVLAVVPYYNKPNQKGLIQHFTLLAENSSLPVILYNVPGRTGVGLSLKSVLELSHHPHIAGIKEASGDLHFGKEILEGIEKIQKESASSDTDFIVLSGDDDTGFELSALGAKGIISVVSHLLGKEMKNILQRLNLSQSGWMSVALEKPKTSSIANQKTETKEMILKEYKEKYSALLKSIYCESNPIGIKMALYLMGIFQSAELRSPLTALEEDKTKNLKKDLFKNRAFTIVP